MNFDLIRAVLFDWGNTLMVDDSSQMAAMQNWPQVEMVPGADTLLSSLHARGLSLALATGALVSDESDIRAALARVQLAQYLPKIYCYSNTGQRKPSEEFYSYILDDLQLEAEQVLMVGDSFASDVLGPNCLGIPAVWYNPHSQETKEGKLHTTVHKLDELIPLFQPRT
jgi:putative hydrolase of the HAD superfamily